MGSPTRCGSISQTHRSRRPAPSEWGSRDGIPKQSVGTSDCPTHKRPRFAPPLRVAPIGNTSTLRVARSSLQGLARGDSTKPTELAVQARAIAALPHPHLRVAPSGNTSKLRVARSSLQGLARECTVYQPRTTQATQSDAMLGNRTLFCSSCGSIVIVTSPLNRRGHDDN